MSVPAESAWLLEMGHTRLKWARLSADGSETLEPVGAAMESGRIAALVDEIAGDPGAGVLLSAVPGAEAVAALTARLDAAGIGWKRVRTGTPELPVKPAYPGLGVDRWLALQWPWIRTRGAFCVADCGSAVTVDVVDADGRHRGGWILPGLRPAAEGLVARVPGLSAAGLRCGDAPGDAHEPAMETGAALSRGLALQLAGGVGACLRAAERSVGQTLPLWLTGGDAAAVESSLDPAEVDPHLVLRGLALVRGKSNG